MNKAGGYIALHRQIIGWEWYTDVSTKVLFFHLLLTANFTDTKFMGKKIKRGQLVTSLKNLANETGLSVQNVRTALNHLCLTGEVTNQSYRTYRIITVSNYDKYQTITNQPTKQLTNNQQTTNKQLTNNQQHHNKDNKEINNNKSLKRFIRPTVEEIAAYCKERGNNIDPQYFYDYQEARGWVLSNGKQMKNWKATINTWEKKEWNRNGKHGNRDGDHKADDGESRPDFSYLRDTVTYV